MLMAGDLNKIIVQVNHIIEATNRRVAALEDKIMALEAPVAIEPPVKRGPGRPAGSKNKSTQ